MRNLILILLTVVLFSCTSEPVDYATVHGVVSNDDVKMIVVKGKEYSKNIILEDDGKFSDTLKVADGLYLFMVGTEKVTVFLKNGYDLGLQFNNNVDSSSKAVVFTGEGAETNNFLEEKKAFFISDYSDPNTYFSLDKEEYTNRVSEAKKLLNDSKMDITKVDTSVISMVNQSNKMLFGYVESNYEKMRANSIKLAKGAVSPEFVNYENIKGGTTSLKDLKGKFVYVDVWATWCGPCKVEIPNLKALEKDFHGKNIEFVSISVDNVDGRRGSHESWLKMVKDKELGGIQLFADKDFNSQFIQEYGINSIPRFILIDPQGNIVDANAKRPSDPGIRDYFKELGI